MLCCCSPRMVHIMSLPCAVILIHLAEFPCLCVANTENNMSALVEGGWLGVLAVWAKSKDKSLRLVTANILETLIENGICSLSLSPSLPLSELTHQDIWQACTVIIPLSSSLSLSLSVMLTSLLVPLRRHCSRCCANPQKASQQKSELPLMGMLKLHQNLLVKCGYKQKSVGLSMGLQSPWHIFATWPLRSLYHYLSPSLPLSNEHLCFLCLANELLAPRACSHSWPRLMANFISSLSGPLFLSFFLFLSLSLSLYVCLRADG